MRQISDLENAYQQGKLREENERLREQVAELEGELMFCRKSDEAKQKANVDLVKQIERLQIELENKAFRENERLRAEVEELKGGTFTAKPSVVKDAERYQWLKENASNRLLASVHFDNGDYDADDLDSAIDAAMEKTTK